MSSWKENIIQWNPLFNEVQRVTNYFDYPSNSNTFEKKPPCNESQGTGKICFAITRFCYIKVLCHIRVAITGVIRIVCYTKDFII